MYKMYILVRNDLPRNVQTVQACHAAAECALYKNDLGWDNGTMVVLGVQDHAELMQWNDKIKTVEIRDYWYDSCDKPRLLSVDTLNPALFQETDMAERPETALAVIVPEQHWCLFEELRLLKQ